MSGSIFYVMGLVFFLFLWAALGHGIWLIAAGMIRELFGKRCESCKRKHLGEACNCRQSVLRSSVKLNENLKREVPSLSQDLESAKRLIALARFKAWLNDEQLSELEQLVQSLCKRSLADMNTGGAAGHAPSAAALAEPPLEALKADSRLAIASVEQNIKQAVIVASIVDQSPAMPGTIPVEARPATKDKRPIHPLDMAYDSAQIRPARAPIQQRLTAGLLKSFMEQSNIRWVELISAALIVICSVGLVISLWSTLSSTSRFFPSLVFLLATVAVHGAGQYTLRQWKLRATSRGILHIGLMLIPLAVLVGILLSRRQDGLPKFDVFTIAILGVGTLVYSALAVTASQSLFARRWLVPAVLTIVAALTLLPIHYLGERQLLQQSSTTALLLPLIFVSMWSALSMSRSRTDWQAGPRVGSKRRIAGIVTQSLFAIAVPVVFWILQAKGTGGVGQWWWVATGIIAATWSAWGWSASFTGKSIVNEKSITTAVNATPLKKPLLVDSWFSIAAWLIASVFSVFLLAAIWQTGSNRITVAALLLGAAIWWLIYGWNYQLRLGLVAGGVALLTATTFVIEAMLAESTLNQATDWIGLRRISILTLVGGIATIAATLAQSFASKIALQPSSGFFRKNSKASFRTVLQQLQIAGGVVIGGAAILTLVASLMPSGETPYGGNWAALLLITYGLAAIGSGVAACQWAGSTLLLRGLVPVGQAIMLLGTVRLCQTSPLLAELLSSLRPVRAWASGTAILAVGWSLLAAGIKVVTLRSGARRSQDERPQELSARSDEWQKSNIDWLCGFAGVVGICSALAIWSNPDQLRLASLLGWFLPLSCFAIFISWQQAAWREVSLIALSAWTCSLAYSVGDAYHWWPDLGLAGTVSVLVATAALTLAIFEQSLATIQAKLKPPAKVQVDQLATEKLPISSIDYSWLMAKPYWASGLLLACGWIVVLLGLLGPLISHLPACFASVSESTSSSNWLRSLGNTGLGLVLLCGIALTAASAWIGKKYQQVLLLDAMALLSVIVAFAMGAWIVPPYSLTAVLWSAAVMLIASEALQWVNTEWETRSLQAWERLVASKIKISREYEWLPLTRTILVAMLAVGTLAFLVVAVVGDLPAELVANEGSWISNAFVLFLSLGPALIFGLARWKLSVWNGEPHRVTAFSGVLASIGSASISAFALTGGATWPDSVIVWLQCFALMCVVLAGTAMGFTAIRNYLGLRRILAGKISNPELVSKSMKGSRWQRIEKSSWMFAVLAISAVVAMCLGAALIVVAYPSEQLLGFDRLGGPVVGATVALTLVLFWFLSVRRGASHFGILAISLGLLAPLGAAAYANWLIIAPTRSFPTARDFEPFRTLIVLWLISLSIGLAVRIAAAVQGKRLSQLGEVAWILLASIVGGLALVSTTQDPNSLWPMSELSALALIAVLSSVAAGQAWRGHIAAVAAAAGISAWLLHSNDWHMLWNVLWGPTWVGLIAIAAKLVIERSYFRLGESNRTGEVRQTGSPHWTVDQSVSLLVPLASAILSFLWILIASRSNATVSGLHWSILSLSLAGLVLAVTRLWELQPSKRGLAFYFNLVSCALVLAAILSVYARLPQMHTWLIWLASGLGAMAVIAGLLREMVREASVLGPTLRFGAITQPAKLRHALNWMPAVHTMAALMALVPSILLVLSFEERTMRVAATILPFIGALSILPIALDRGSRIYRYWGLILISSSLVLLFWADLPVAWTVAGIEGAWKFVQRAFIAFVVLGIVYPAVVQLLRNKDDWERPLMHVGWVAFAIGVTIGFVMLGGEAMRTWDAAAATASLPTKLMTIVAWAAVTVRLLQFAVRPQSIDCRATDRTRKAAVYFAELSLALLCGSCYFHFPELFGGIFVKWWPLVVFAIAMLSAGIGEWMRRLDQHIIADPIGRSSLLLPIIPLTGVWWFRPEGADWLWNDWGRYSFLLLSAALLYGLQSWLRNSIRIRALASMLILFSFWAFLHSNPDLQFFDHPQFWMLPPALAVLLFVEFNRNRLVPSVVVAARYMAVLIAYLSSTAEVFFKAFEGQLWQPLLLLVLALAGVAAGIVMRVRAFLYCGLAFTMIALLGMVWHAQQAIGQVWPWWAFGIATGVSLIALLGYFEKNRPKVVSYLEQFKKWEQ